MPFHQVTFLFGTKLGSCARLLRKFTFIEKSSSQIDKAHFWLRQQTNFVAKWRVSQILVWSRKRNCISKNLIFGADCSMVASSCLISFEMRQEMLLPSIASIITRCWPTFFQRNLIKSTRRDSISNRTVHRLLFHV